MKKNAGHWLIIGLLLLICTTSFCLAEKVRVLTEEQEKYVQLRNQVNSDREKSRVDITEPKEKRPAQRQEIEEGSTEKMAKEILPEYRTIYKENPDFAGWITIEGTRIDYPVMLREEDREYYLHRDFYGKESYAGVPFVGNGDFMFDNDIFIYGHNMKNGTMFAELLNYCHEDYWKAHTTIQLNTLREYRVYEIFTVFYATENDWTGENGLFHFVKEQQEMERENYLSELINRGFYETEIKPDKSAPLIFLVTCSYQERNGRLVIAGTKK